MQTGNEISEIADRVPEQRPRWAWLDAIRGFAILVMFFDHCAPYFGVLAHLPSHTFEFLGLVSMAEIFVLASGASAGLAYVIRWREVEDKAPRTIRIRRRGVRIYLAHLLTVVVLALLIAWSPEATPHLNEGASTDPVKIVLWGTVLLYQPRLLNVLPLYVLLYLVLLPIIRCIERWGPLRVLAGSAVIWFVSQFIPPVSEARTHGAILLPQMHFLSWQLLFVIGLCVPLFVSSPFYQKASTRLRAGTLAGCGAVALYFALSRHLGGDVMPSWLIDRGRIGALRMVNVLALLSCVLALAPAFRNRRPPRMLTLLGTEALTAYTASLLAINVYEFTFFRFVNLGPGWEQLLMFAMLLGSMFGAAAIAASRRARSRTEGRIASEAPNDRTRRGMLPFWAAVALLPTLIVDGFGNLFFEPKLALLLLLAVCSLVVILVRAARGMPVRFDSAMFCCAAIFLLRLLSSTHAQNPGLVLQSLGLIACMGIVVPFARTMRLQEPALVRSVVPAALVVIIGSGAMIFYRRVLFNPYASFGSTIGLKNSVSVFLAQLVPLMLLGLVESRAPRLCYGRVTKLVFGAVLVAALYVIFANRTRSAWWMLIVYGGVLLVFSVRRPEGEWRKLLTLLSGAAAAALVLLLVLPNKLQWRSQTPYLDSFTTLASVEHSNGRDALWRVGAEMIKEAPVRGVGAGNAPALWQGYIEKAGLDPTLFRFLRNDLPLFNDYLQEAVESGPVSAALLSALAIFIPLQLLKLQLRGRRGISTAAVLLLSVAFGTGLDGLFDNPFGRAETVLMFALSLGIATRLIFDPPEGAEPRALRQGMPRGMALIAGSLVGALLLYTLILLTVGLGARKYWKVTNRVSALELALEWWPWDVQWETKHLDTLYAAGANDAAKKLVETRMHVWPHDAESYRIAAALAEKEGRFAEARDHYRRAIVMVEGGRCNWAGYQQYLKYAARREVPQEAHLSDDDLKVCK